MEINLVAEGLKFMVLGMSIVFIFLALLVQMMKWQKSIVDRYFPSKELPKSVYAPRDDEKTRVAAIVVAVTEFRKSK